MKQTRGPKCHISWPKAKYGIWFLPFRYFVMMLRNNYNLRLFVFVFWPGHNTITTTAGVGLNFWPHWISTRGVFDSTGSAQDSCWIATPETGGNCITTPMMDNIWTLGWIVTLCLDSTLNYEPQVLIPRWMLTPSPWFNVKLRPGIGIITQCVILTRGHISTWNFDPGS